MGNAEHDRVLEFLRIENFKSFQGLSRIEDLNISEEHETVREGNFTHGGQVSNLFAMTTDMTSQVQHSRRVPPEINRSIAPLLAKRDLSPGFGRLSRVRAPRPGA